MRVTTTGFYDRATRQLGTLMSRADLLNTQIATTKRIQTASDDAPAYRTLAGLARATADDKAYKSNLTIAGSVLATADTVLSDVADQLQQVNELATRAANGTFTAEQRRAIGLEITEIAKGLVLLANRTDPRGAPVFGGADGGPGATRQPDGTYLLATTAASAIPIGEGESVQANESAARVFGFTGSTGPTDAITLVTALAAALTAGDETGASAAGALDDIKLAIDQVTGAQASIGARAARVEMTQAQAAEAALTREEARSALEDTDVTAAAVELQKTLTILKATEQSFSQLSRLSLFDYLR